ncbi:MAG: hypothetical protein AUF67_08065 [Acidobacteria bacterium 13_1_20CM_58_21]|nr:MAG: hypothetical protein AUF67_08065 [Acidobacteria bacterium 13_1_20CM_58_21]
MRQARDRREITSTFLAVCESGVPNGGEAVPHRWCSKSAESVEKKRLDLLVQKKAHEFTKEEYSDG